MNKLIFKTEVKDPFGNVKLFKTFLETQTGNLIHRLMGQSGTLFSVSNMQCKGWVPDNFDEFADSKGSIHGAMVEFIDSGLYTRVPGTTKWFPARDEEVKA